MLAGSKLLVASLSSSKAKNLVLVGWERDPPAGIATLLGFAGEEYKINEKELELHRSTTYRSTQYDQYKNSTCNKHFRTEFNMSAPLFLLMISNSVKASKQSNHIIFVN